MSNNQTLTVNKRDYAETTVTENEVKALESGQVLLKILDFSFTANNITYAAMGDMLKYWEFFPAEEGRGVIPVWGFAEVVESRCEGVEIGEKFYGYYPMAKYLTATPGQVNDASFIDVTEHRQPLPIIYNQYIRCSHDPIYQAETEALQMLLRPLFTTSFLLDDFFDDNGFFGSEQLVLTSASSKTALGMAFLLWHNRKSRDNDYKIIGLTSASNKEFVESLGCYDQVVTYDELTNLDAALPTSVVDFAGNGDVLGKLHGHFNDQLQYSCLVGASHWDQRAGMPAELAGPQPVMFFAPTQAEKRIKEWGGAEFQQKVAVVWKAFIEFVDDWMDVEEHRGAKATDGVYQTVLEGRFNPKAGYIVSLWD